MKREDDAAGRTSPLAGSHSPRTPHPASLSRPQPDSRAHPRPHPESQPRPDPERVRPAESADLHDVLALLRAADLPAEGVAERFPVGYGVAVEGGRLVGAAGVERYGSAGLLRSVVVSGALRGRGLGVAIVDDRLRWSASEGLEALYLLTDTVPGFFARLGFTEIDRSRAPEGIRASAEFASICPASAIVMMRRLDSSPGREGGHQPDREPMSDRDGTRSPGAAGRAGAPGSTATEPRPAGLSVIQDGTLTQLAPDEIRAHVREKYGAAALRAGAGARSSCGCGCGSAEAAASPITSDLYDEAETRGLPAEAVLASLGCGNPTALAQLEPGQVVLDLGSGGGIDVLLSAKRVGPGGMAYGLDMTDEMLELARANQRRSGIDNVEFLKGAIEEIPLPDDSVDVIISNCVINLSADKSRVLREAWRVLRPGGRFAVSDIVVRGEVPDAVRRNVELWMGCVAGALEEGEYVRLLDEAGFTAIEIEPTRIYTAADARAFLEAAGAWDPHTAALADGRFMSAFIRARKQATPE